ncbi:DUF2207 domain-containing protein [Nonomuraea jabiensis]|uniref:DUF2207 domain-containing protein n=1 Tax=Nonomuraea jabiensis TaxID=882448 RepID=UPI003691DA9F
MRQLLRLILALCALLLAGSAAAQAATHDDPSYTLPGTSVLAEVAADGRVAVTEKHAFTWQRPGHAAYVDIPLTSEMRVEDILISEGDVAYHHSPDTVGGADRPAGTYRTACCDADQQRVSWYFSAAPGSTRTFTVRYTLRGAVTAYPDQAFLRLPVWGKNWPRALDLLQVEIRLPRGGDPGEGVLESGKGSALTIDATTRTATMTERRVAPGQARTAELAFPRGLLDDNPEGADVVSGLGSILGIEGPRASLKHTIGLAMMIIIGAAFAALMLAGLVSEARERRRASRSPGAGTRPSGSSRHSYGGYSGGGSSSGVYSGTGGSSGGGGGGGAC